MDMEEKFLKIMNKAEVNGFSFRDGSELHDVKYIDYGRFDASIITDQENESGETEKVHSSFIFNVYEVFFNHNFAKAFFGIKEECATCSKELASDDWIGGECTSCGTEMKDKTNVTASWQKCLREMVLEKDIMSYLLNCV